LSFQKAERRHRPVHEGKAFTTLFPDPEPTQKMWQMWREQVSRHFWTLDFCHVFMTSTPNLPRANTRAGYFSSTHTVCIPFFPISFAGLFLIETFIFPIFGNCSQLSFFELSSHTDVTPSKLFQQPLDPSPRPFQSPKVSFTGAKLLSCYRTYTNNQTWRQGRLVKRTPGHRQI